MNRLLQEIRRLQAQVQRQQQGQSAIADEPSDRSGPMPIFGSGPQSAHAGLGSNSGSVPRSPSFPHHPRSSFDMARADIQRRSRTPSRGASPHLRSTSISGESGEQWILGGRDENAFYQAETHMLIRENQMLRHRIRDLGKLPQQLYILSQEDHINFTNQFARTTTVRGDWRHWGRRNYPRALPYVQPHLLRLDLRGFVPTNSGDIVIHPPADCRRCAQGGVVMAKTHLALSIVGPLCGFTA